MAASNRDAGFDAVIVAGGLGTRMWPLTERHPKHLLNVGGVAFLDHQLSRLAAAGAHTVVLATSYQADRFAPVLGDGSRWGVRLEYVQETQPLGTAGAIRNAADHLSAAADAPVVVLNGDVLSGHDLQAQLADFGAARDGRVVDVSLHLVQVPDARAFGCVPTDQKGRITAFLEKSEDPVTRQVNAGCYIFRRRVVDRIPTGRVVSVERETFPLLVEDGHLLVGFVDDSYWRDVGSPDSLVAASTDLVRGVAPSPAVPGGLPAAVAESASVADGATVDAGSVVADRARVGDGAHVSGSVAMTGAAVGSDAVVVDSVLGPGVEVGPRARLYAAAVGDDTTISAGTTLGSGSRIGCGKRV